MPDPGVWWFSALTFALSMSGSPGPNNAMVAASGANFGFVRTLPHMAGVSVGFPLMLVAVALGAGDILRAFPVIHVVLKWAGIAYLLWLALKIALARPVPAGRSAGTAVHGASRPLTFLQAALFQWINPKAWVIALGAVASYTSVEGRTVLPRTFALAAIFLVITVATTAFWTGTGVGAARVLRSERGLRRFNLVMAALLVASLVTLVY